VLPAVVMAAGEGRRMRPLTERYAKPVLPIDGVPVVAGVLRGLAEAGCTQVTVVAGHLSEQVEQLCGDGSGFGIEVRYARQESPDGSAHAVVAAGATPPYLVVGADKLFTRGDLGRFAQAFEASGAAGALAVEPRPGTVRIRDGLVQRVLDSGLLGAPLWAVGPAVAPFVEALPGKLPFELATAFQAAIDAGEPVAGIEIGPTRDLTAPIDVLEQNFPYLRQL
jgi:GTP:adenosylcobinamide-phosphate guanylyltransferase